MTRMILLFFPLLVLLSGCKKEKKESLFELTYAVDVSIQPGWNTFETYFVEIDGLSTRVEQQLNNHNLTYDAIGRVETAYAELYNVFGDVNLDMLDEVTVDIFPPGKPTSRLEAAYLNPVPDDALTRLQLIPSLANFKQFFKNETFGMRVGLRPREIPGKEVQCRLEIRMAFLE